MPVSLIPESAPFDTEQRAWLNGFLAGLLGMQETNGNGQSAFSATANITATTLIAPAAVNSQRTDAEEDLPWHDPALPMDERLQMANGKPLQRRLMAAMAQLDCGACGYLCQTYSEAIARGEEKSLTLCSPGGKDTVKMLKKILKEGAGDAAQRNGNNNPKRERGTA